MCRPKFFVDLSKNKIQRQIYAGYKCSKTEKGLVNLSYIVSGNIISGERETGNNCS